VGGIEWAGVVGSPITGTFCSDGFSYAGPTGSDILAAAYDIVVRVHSPPLSMVKYVLLGLWRNWQTHQI
jgi:hypothetical protein